MNSRTRLSALALLVLLLFPALVLAEQRYISDTLIVSLRDSANFQGEIIAYLKSGEPIEIIEEKEDGFILINTPSGQQGWIQKKYTIDEKPKDLIISELQGQIKALKAKAESVAASTISLKESSQDLKSAMRDKEREVAQLQETIVGLKAAVKNAENRYEELRLKSQGVEEAFAERDQLVDRLKAVDKEVALLRVENAELIQTERLLWFLAGFGVFIVGWIMGKVFRRSRRSSLSL